MNTKTLMLLLTFVGAFTFAQEATLPQATQTALENVLKDAVAKRQIPGAVLVVDKPGLAPWVGHAGKASLSPADPMDGAEAFRVGSITKTFTATLVLRLVDAGKISLDDTLAKWLPDAPLGNYQTGDITVAMLLAHTSGLNNYTKDCTFQDTYHKNPGKEIYSPVQLLEITNKLGPVFPPGKSWAYSNSGYIALGLIAEKATGKTYAQLIAEVSAAAGLKNTYAPERGDTGMPANHANGYVNWTDFNKSKGCITGELPKQIAERRDQVPGYSWSAGDIISTGTDLAIWIEKVSTGQLVSPKLHKLQTNWQQLGPGISAGLGIMRLSGVFGLNKNVWGHSGEISGYTAFAGYVAEDRTSVIFLINKSKRSDLQGYPTVAKALHVLFADTASAASGD